MPTRQTHPDPALEQLLVDLEREGVDPAIIDRFVRRAAERSARYEAANPTSTEVPSEPVEAGDISDGSPPNPTPSKRP